MAAKRKYEKKDKSYWGKRQNKSEAKTQGEPSSEWEPMDTSMASESIRVKKGRSLASTSDSSARTTSRRNRVATEKISDEFKNIRDLELPYRSSKRSSSEAVIDISEVALLCQKAYARVALFRNTIDMMTEFSNAKIYLTGGSAQSRDFINKWMERIKLSSFSEQFFREYYRSGNVFTYKFVGSFSDDDLKKLRKKYTSVSRTAKVPLRYTVLNPCDIAMYAASSMDKGLYKKVLSGYEILKLKQKLTEEDVDVYNSLPKKVRDSIDNDSWTDDGIYLDLDPKRLSAVFYKKQDYEAFATPFGYPVLSDIDHKLEMKKMDRAVFRTVQQVVLLVTMGNEPEKHGLKPKAMAAMRTLLENETVGRTIVSDYTTKMEFIIPEVGDILNPDKYKIVNEDIKEGLQNVMFGGEEKFSNQQTKVQVFLERLSEGRRVFVDDFLIPEIKRVCEQMGIKNPPKPKFQEIDLKDEVEMKRVITRLLELGVLTPEQAFEVMETGVFPTTESMEKAQEEYVKKREKGHFTPLVGGNVFSNGEDTDNSTPDQGGVSDPNNSNNGRPVGKASHGSLKKKDLITIDGLRGSIKSFSSLVDLSESKVRKIHGKKKLTKDQADFAYCLAESVFQTASKDSWEKRLVEILENPTVELVKSVSNKVTEEIDNLCSKYEIDSFQAAIMYHGK